MSHFGVLLEGESCRNLLLALAHTLWQGVLAAGILFLYLRGIPAQAASRRYLAGIVALGSVVLGGLLTWSILSYGPNDVPQVRGPTGVAETAVASANPMTSAPAPSSAEQAPARGPSRASSLWQVWLIEAWAAGVVVMLLRLIVVVIGAGRLRRSCRPTGDAELLTIVQQLRDKMGILRNIRILIGEQIATPGVIGCFWPALLLPVSMTTGIAAEDLQAILVHELAHIKRYDYLVNFVQMIIEALLFFNPAVWWISRQIRIEREACCDAAGVRWIGQGTRYAEALVAWAHRTPAVPAVGFGENPDGGSVLDRVRRILIAGHQPRPHVPWHIAAAMVVLTLACLMVLQQTTSLAVTLAGRILTPQERIRRIGEVSEEYSVSNPAYRLTSEIEVSGVVRAWDAAPLHGQVDLVLLQVGQNSMSTSRVGRRVSKDGVFHVSAARGRIYLMASAWGYAPTFAGPFEALSGATIQDIDLVLGEGYVAGVRVTDEDGQPVEDAALVNSYVYPDGDPSWHSPSPQIETRSFTDVNGLAFFDHAVSQRAVLEISASGFQPLRIAGVVLDPNEIRIVTLKRMRLTAGVVVAQATGQPIAGAKVRISARSQPNGHFEMASSPEAITDTEGRFELAALRSDGEYVLFARAFGYGYQYVSGVIAGDQSVRIVLGEPKTIRGKITGDLSLLAKGLDSTPMIKVKNGYPWDQSGRSEATALSPVVVRDGIGYFETNDFCGQTVTLRAGNQEVRLDIEKDRLDNVVIDLGRPARRQVVLRFQTPPGAPLMEGSVRINYRAEDGRGAEYPTLAVRCLGERGLPEVWFPEEQGTTSEWLPIKDNQVQCEIPVPARFKYGIDFFRGERPMGYWFSETRPTTIAPGDTPYAIDVPVFPAGAICGRVLRSDGSLAQTARALLIMVEKPDVVDEQTSRFGLEHAMRDRGDGGIFNASPLPLGGRYALLAYEGYASVRSDTFKLDETNPIINADLKLPRGFDVEGRLLHADGTPAHNELRLNIALQRGKQLFSITSDARVRPDETGRFVFKNVDPGPQGMCTVEGIGEAGYRPIKYPLKDLRVPITIQAEKGARVTGTVIDGVIGRPVPGVEVRAFGNGETLASDSRTDEQGRFVFSTMAQQQYELFVLTPYPVPLEQPTSVTGGQSAPAVLRIRVPQENRSATGGTDR